MTRIRAHGFAIACMALFAPWLDIAGAKPVSVPGYSVTQRWTLGGAGGWDLLAVDAGSRRLYLSRSDRVIVVDTDTGKVAGEIAHTDGVHGIALAPALGRGYTSNGKANSVTVFDLKTLKPLAEVKIDGKNPDVILYDAARQRVYTFNGRSNDISIIDANTLALAGTIALDGKPEFAVLGSRGQLYVNIEDKSELALVDLDALKVTAVWKLPDCEEPTGLAFDGAHHRLFSACANHRLAVTDSEDGHSVASVPIGGGPDGAEFDASSALVFTPNGSDGTLSIIHEDDPDHFSVVSTVTTQKSARTIVLDAQSHRLFLPAAEFGEAPKATADQPHPRPPVLPGSFKVLVVGPKE